MASVSEPDSEEALSQSWPDTEMGLLEQPPESPPIQKRKTYSHYTQVGNPLKSSQFVQMWNLQL